VAPGVPVLGARTRLRRLRTPDGPIAAGELEGRRVLAFAGLGRPQGFADLLAAAGAEVVLCRWFADHHHYREQDLFEVLAAAKREELVAVTTAKDAVKLPADAAVWVAEIEVEPVDGDWQRLWQLCPALAGEVPQNPAP